MWSTCWNPTEVFFFRFCMAFKNKQTILADFFPAKRSSSKLILSKVTNLSRNHFLFLPQIFPPIFDYSVALENCLKYCLKTLKHVFLPFSVKWSKICFNHKNVWFFSDFLIPFFIGSYHRNWVFYIFSLLFQCAMFKKKIVKNSFYFSGHITKINKALRSLGAEIYCFKVDQS